MSTLELEHIKHTSSSSNNLSTHSDGSLTVGNVNALSVTGHAAVGADIVAGTRALSIAGATDGGSSEILNCFNSSLASKFSVRDDGFIQATKGAVGTLATFTDGIATNFTFKTDASNVGTFGTEAGSTHLAFMASGTERMRITSAGDTEIDLFKPTKYQPLIGPVTCTGGFVSGAATSTYHSITNVDINNYAGGYASGQVGIHGEIMWTSGVVAQGYNHTLRFMIPPNSSNTHSSYSAGNFSSFSYAGNIYSEIPCTVTHHTSMTSNHDIRLRLRNSTGTAYDPLRLEIFTSAGISGDAKLTLWRG